ncbi:MAG: flagellar biosynthesis anti-sigma factor FlgM [Nitrospirales bacterium]
MAIHPLDSFPPLHPEPTKKRAHDSTHISNDSTPPPSLNPQSATQDTLELSKDSSDYKAIQEAIKEVPDIRQNKIQRIQEALAAKRYQVSSTDLADRLIQDTIINTPRKPG